MESSRDNPRPLIRLENVGKSFAGHPVLRGVSFDLLPGEVHVLAGENGAGKSTLIKILAGVHTEYDGQLLLRGEPARLASPQDAARQGISVIHQELSLIDSLTVAENILLGREPAAFGQWLSPAEERRLATDLCRRTGLDVDVGATIDTLPLAVRNRVEIAKALAAGEGHPSRVLIMDEPTSALNAPEAEALFHLIGELKAQGFGIIYISHKMEEIYRLADRITVLRDGRHVGTARAADLPARELVRWMVGRELSEQFPGRQAPLDPAAPKRLEARALSSPGRFEDVSLHVRAGEILGIAGLQGSGNSELFHAMFGSYGSGAVTGELLLDGKPARPRSPGHAIRRGLALLTHDRKATGLVLGMSIRDNVTMASLGKSSTAGWLRPARENAAADRQKHALSIRAQSREQETGTLSGGNQQKVALGKWLETDPAVLLLDEPTRGVDIGAKHEIYELIHGLTAQGRAVVLITSEMPELLALSDRILVMHRGRVAAELERGQATQEKVLEAAMGL